MIIACTECRTRYAVPDRAIPPEGRMVRCARCQHSWFYMPEVRVEEISPELSVEMPAFEEPEQRLRPIPESSGLPATIKPQGAPGWLIAAAAASILLALSTGLVAFRTPLQRMISPLSHLYSGLGMSGSHGITLTNVALTRLPSQKRERYLVEGMIVNTTNEPRATPTLRLSMLSDKGDVIQYVEFAPNAEQKTMAPGAKLPFSTNLERRFQNAVTVRVEIGSGLELALR